MAMLKRIGAVTKSDKRPHKFLAALGELLDEAKHTGGLVIATGTHESHDGYIEQAVFGPSVTLNDDWGLSITGTGATGSGVAFPLTWPWVIVVSVIGEEADTTHLSRKDATAHSPTRLVRLDTDEEDTEWHYTSVALAIADGLTSDDLAGIYRTNESVVHERMHYSTSGDVLAHGHVPHELRHWIISCLQIGIRQSKVAESLHEAGYLMPTILTTVREVAHKAGFPKEEED